MVKKKVDFKASIGGVRGRGPKAERAWTIWADSKVVQTGKSNGARDNAERDADEALRLVEDHYNETGEIKKQSISRKAPKPPRKLFMG